MESRPAQASGVVAALVFAARALLIVSFVLLTQFLLGIVVNLFVDVPDTHPGAGVANYVVGAWRSIGWALAREWPVLALHIIVGLGLVAGSLTFLIRGLLARNWSALLLWNAIGAAGAAFAALNGTYFVIHPKVDSASLFMAVGFAVAIGSVIIQLFLVGRAGLATSGRPEREDHG